MLDNKGFAVTSVLYTLLIAFLLFLGVSLSMLSTSNSLISNMNRDLTDNLYVNAYLNIDNKNDLSNYIYDSYVLKQYVIIKELFIGHKIFLIKRMGQF